MIRNPTHGNGIVSLLIAGSQGNFQYLGSLKGIVEEHLIEVPQTIEKEGIRILGFNFMILRHHGRHFNFCSHGGRPPFLIVFA